MANTFLRLADGAAAGVQTVFDTNTALADGSRVAVDYANSAHLDPYCDALLSVYFDTAAPSAGAVIGELYVLFGDGGASESFPEGGDGTVGANVTPQADLLVGVFETVAPSITTAERLQIQAVALCPFTNRFVLRNVSSQQFNLNWQLDIRPRRLVGAS